MAREARVKLTMQVEPHSLTDLHVVTLWLSVIRPEHRSEQNLILSMHSGNLWVKRQRMAFLPVVARGFDDQVTLWADEDGDDRDPMGGPQWGVRRRYWDADGLAHLELTRIVLDPDEESQRMILSEAARGICDFSSWETDVDGDPEPKLERGGWSKRL